MSCSKDKKSPVPGEPTLRYETVPYGSTGSKSSVKSGDEAYKLAYWDHDNDNNYYLFVLGYIRSVPLASSPGTPYNGVSGFEISYQRSNVNQTTVSESVSKAITHSFSKSHSDNWNVGIGTDIGPSWFKVKLSANMGGSDGWDETNSRSISNSFDVSSSTSSGESFGLKYNIGSNGELPGKYRIALYSITDVYYIVKTDRAKTKVTEAYISLCARTLQDLKLDYDPDENGSFGKTASGELLAIPNIDISQLPDIEDDTVLPVLTTSTVTDITATTATLGGNITDAGTPTYIEKGVVYATTSNPTIANNPTIIAGTGTGSFNTSITGLTPNTLYYVRAYATNVLGTAYGEPVSFTTLTDIDGVSYIDENGATQFKPFAEITNFTSETKTLGNGWYFVNVNNWLTVESQIVVSGNTHLILGDGCNLTAKAGINVSGTNKLNIYAQSTGTTMGSLTATGSNASTTSNSTIGASAGIGGSHAQNCGTIIINGGKVTATGGDAGSGGGSSNLGGAGAGAGIGGGGGDGTKSAGNSAVGTGGNITINGGTIIAKGGNGGKGGDGYSFGGYGRGGGGAAAGIGGGGGKGQADGTTNGNGTYTAGGNGGVVTINGGIVESTGGSIGSSGIGGGGGGGGAGIGGGGGGGRHANSGTSHGNAGENIGNGGSGGNGASGGAAADYTPNGGSVTAKAGQ